MLPNDISFAGLGYRNSSLNDIERPTLELIRYRAVNDHLLKAITSVKISPTGRHGLIGYGVRSEGKVVLHEFETAACEVIQLHAEGLPWAAVMCDDLDEVNIAQFHPIAGGGLIYGTKRGRVRVFRRSQMFAEEQSEDQDNRGLGVPAKSSV